MRRWFVLRHVEHEHLGSLTDALHARGLPFEYVDIFRGGVVPADISESAGLIVMGGPMGVYEVDQYPFIRNELDLIRRAVTAGLPVLGICLGSQLIAAALGARVYPSGRKEIGWYGLRTVEPGDSFAATLPESFMGFHWHGDTFDLPVGAVRLFESDLFPNQGFRFGRNVLALQFHFEVDRKLVAEWLADPGCQAEIAGVAGISAAGILDDTARHGARLEQLSAAYFPHILTLLTADEKA